MILEGFPSAPKGLLIAANVAILVSLCCLPCLPCLCCLPCPVLPALLCPACSKTCRFIKTVLRAASNVVP